DRRVGVHADSDAAWALGDGLLVVVAGDGADVAIEQVLDHRDAARARDEPAALPDAVGRARRHAPKGLQACSLFELEQLLDLPWFELLDVDDLLRAALGADGSAAFAGLRPLFASQDLLRAVGFAGWQDEVWSYRVLW